MANSIKNNRFSVEIKESKAWKSVKGMPVFPFSHGELLDERLDEAYITIVNDKTEAYAPLTEVRVLKTVTEKVLYSAFSTRTFYLEYRVRRLKYCDLSYRYSDFLF